MQKNIMPRGSSFFRSILVGIQSGATFALGALPPPSVAAARSGGTAADTAQPRPPREERAWALTP
jgi:hypothetical protein